MAHITLDGVDQIVLATPKAVLIRFKDLTERWVPRSVCENGDELSEGDTDIVVAEWFAMKEGLD